MKTTKLTLAWPRKRSASAQKAVDAAIVQAACRYVGIYEGWITYKDSDTALQRAFEHLRAAVFGRSKK